MTPEQYRASEGADMAQCIEDSRSAVVIAYLVIGAVSALLGLGVGWMLWG
jgi:hypothetical protein